MGKRKREDPDNLNRLRYVVKDFVSDNTDSAAVPDTRSYPAKGIKVTARKEKRKEMRKLKKMQKLAFVQRKKIPTMESINEEKQKVITLKEDKKKAATKRKKKQEQRKRSRASKRETETSRLDEIRVADNDDDREIKRCEKLLRLNKRKSKSISLGFRNDGLAYLLEAVDQDCLKALYETGGEDGDTNPALHTITAADIDVDSGGEEGDIMDSDDDDDIMDSDDDGSGDDEQPEEVRGMTKAKAEIAHKEALVDQIMENVKGEKKGVSKKQVRFIEEAIKAVKKEAKGEVEEEEDEDSDSGEGSEDDIEGSEDDIEGSEDDLEGDDELERAMEEESDPNSDMDDDENNVEEDEDTDEDDDEEEDPSSSDESNEVHSLSEIKAKELKEDIYGRLRDTEGNVVNSEASSKPVSGAYVPPGKRLAMAKGDDEKRKIELERLKKQLKGLINRLSESNMQPISNQIAELFRAHSRAGMMEVLTEVVLAACVAPYTIPEKLITEHAMLMAILHGNIGTEVGAMFLQSLAQKFAALCEDNDRYDNTKEMDNLLVLMAMLYNFKIVHSELMFEIMKKLSKRFKEKDVELLLLLLRTIGFGLRKDNPASLKEFIVDIQNKSSEMDTSQTQEQSRVKFMLETIMHIRNNNVRKIPNYDPSHMEHLKKLLRNYITGSGGDAELRISLSDLLEAEQRGKWWLVGSAWQGRELQPANMGGDIAGMAASAPTNVSSRILELARKQRMNTDTRRTIFCIIMTSEDYVDAFEKLLRLGLKNQQEREIIHVIVDVCLQEKKHNAFYDYLAQKFCEYDRRFQMTVQFNVWDKFKQLSSWKQQKISNLAHLLSHLIATKAMSLSVFKVIEFADLDKSKVRLMKQVLTSLLLEYPDYICQEVFVRVSSLDKLSSLRDGLKLFMRHFLLRRTAGVKDGEDSIGELRTRVEMAEKALSVNDGKMRM